MAICQVVGSGKVVGIYVEMLPKLTFGSQNKKTNLLGNFRNCSEKGKKFEKILKILTFSRIA